VTKLFAVRLLAPLGSVDVIKGVFRFTYVENKGAAFGMLADNRWVFMILSTVAIVALLIYLWRFRPDSKFACFSIALIIAGGIGNMIDRVALGYVIDFIDFCAFPNLWQWVFNMADAYVCVGGGMLVVWLIISMVKDYKAEKAAKTSVAKESGEETPTDSTENTEN
jgi:signal peptidase II